RRNTDGNAIHVNHRPGWLRADGNEVRAGRDDGRASGHQQSNHANGGNALLHGLPPRRLRRPNSASVRGPLGRIVFRGEDARPNRFLTQQAHGYWPGQRRVARLPMRELVRLQRGVVPERSTRLPKADGKQGSGPERNRRPAEKRSSRVQQPVRPSGGPGRRQTGTGLDQPVRRRAGRGPAAAGAPGAAAAMAGAGSWVVMARPDAVRLTAGSVATPWVPVAAPAAAAAW